MPADKAPTRAAHWQGEWVPSYTQSDVDTIRAHIIASESAKRRRCLLALLLTTVGLVGALVLLSSSYGLYSRSQAEKREFEMQSAASKKRADETQQALDERNARDEELSRARARAQDLMGRIAPSVLGKSDVQPEEAARFAKAVYECGGRFETATRPPNQLFRNWKVRTDSGSEIYAVIGGFVGGKWVIYSNLIGRSRNVERGASEERKRTR